MLLSARQIGHLMRPLDVAAWFEHPIGLIMPEIGHMRKHPHSMVSSAWLLKPKPCEEEHEESKPEDEDTAAHDGLTPGLAKSTYVV